MKVRAATAPQNHNRVCAKAHHAHCELLQHFYAYGAVEVAIWFIIMIGFLIEPSQSASEVLV